MFTMGAAAPQLSAVAHVCALMSVCSFDGANTFTATAASFLIILRHTRLLPLRLLPLPQLSSVHPPLPPSVSPSLPPSLAGLYLPAVLRGNYRSLVTVSDCTAMLHFGLSYNTHIWTHKYSVDMVLSRPDIKIILAFFCEMCV